MGKLEDDELEPMSPSDKYADFAVAPIAVAEDGGPVPALGAVADLPPVPNIAADNFKCIVGPCRHYWHLRTLGPDGGSVLKQHSHTCLRAARETDLGDECVFECTAHDPIGFLERRRRKKSQRKAAKAAAAAIAARKSP